MHHYTTAVPIEWIVAVSIIIGVMVAGATIVRRRWKNDVPLFLGSLGIAATFLFYGLALYLGYNPLYVKAVHMFALTLFFIAYTNTIFKKYSNLSYWGHLAGILVFWYLFGDGGIAVYAIFSAGFIISAIDLYRDYFPYAALMSNISTVGVLLWILDIHFASLGIVSTSVDFLRIITFAITAYLFVAYFNPKIVKDAVERKYVRGAFKI